MPYKSLAARRRRYKMRRLNDPDWVARYRIYQRKYQAKRRRKHLTKVRKYQREWAKKWREKHPRRARSKARAWRLANLNKARAQNQRWYRRFGKAWYRKNRAKRRLRSKKYYRKERRLRISQQRARRRRYYWKNRDRINSTRRKRRVANLDHFRERDRKRYSEHRLKRIVQQRNTQARRAGAPGEITPDQWRRLLRAYKFRCFYCGAKLLPANRTLDHKLPISRGGSNTIDNVVPACRPCNNRKLRMTTEEFLERERSRKKPQ